MKIKFNSDHELPLNKWYKFKCMKIVFRAAFHENNKYYPQVFLCMNNVKMLYFERTDVSKELMLVKQAIQESVVFVNHIYAIDIMIY